jgi:hypothetical protein
MHANLTGYWTSKLDERRVWLSDEFLDFAVTTLPRIAYTLETGEIISKRQAINWLGRVNHEWHRFAVAVHTRRASGSTPRFYRLALDAHKTRRLVRAFIRLYAKKS